MTADLPCADPSRTDDWFISRDGKQYPDDEITEEEQTEALRRRRHAKDACHVECPVRTQCLGLALSEPTPANHGIWGGYFEEELRAIRSERDRRRRARKEAHRG